VDEPALKVFQDDTLRADDQAFFLKVRDVVQAAVSEPPFRRPHTSCRRRCEIPLTGDPVKTVEVLAQRYSLNEAERSACCATSIAQADLSGYGLVNAVTHFSQEVEDYDRATEFEALGGKLIELSHRSGRAWPKRPEPRVGRGSGGGEPPRRLLRRDASELMRTWSRTRAPCPPLTHSSADSRGCGWQSGQQPRQVPPAVASPWSGHLC
jgi:hypothetical protein